MSSIFDEIDLSRTRGISIKDRGSKVTIDQFGEPEEGSEFFSEWLESLPEQLAAADLKLLIDSILQAREREDNEIIWMLGAHVIKCGLSPYIIELMKRKLVTSIAMNGAGLIHDSEIAVFGETSEDVEENLKDGIFGFSNETADICFKAVEMGYHEELGLGEAMGKFLNHKEILHRDFSIFANGYHLGIPVTVHHAVGTDIVNQRETYRGEYWGKLSYRDFLIFSEKVRKLGEAGGVVINVGSAVILPEVFLKALSIARNLDAPFDKITTCNLDMIQHYRPSNNVITRPGSFGGRGFSITGHHEIMIPLIFAGLTAHDSMS